MKKLLSICFLSMLLGLLSFGVRAQSDGCRSGFWIENLQPDTIYGVVNMPPTGKLPLSHTLGQGVFSSSNGLYQGNATVGNTELYELHFCNSCGLDPKTKVSIDWVLLRDGEVVNENLSDYVDFDIYTFYNQLNQYGECLSIKWLGGRVNDGFGYCDTVSGSYTLLDSIAGLNGPCRDPNNYPGAMEPTHGTPYSVLTHLGQIVPAAGQVSIYSQNHDFFYLDFFEQTRNVVVLKWKQAGNYKLVMRVRQRLGGTDWNNEYWKVNPDGTLSQVDYIGGHQSCCGAVLVEDTIAYPTFGEACKEVCEGESYVYGRPPYTFNVTMPDTNVAFGEYRGAEGSDCFHFHTDSVNRFHFFVRETPQVQAQNATICKCDNFDQNSLNALVTIADTTNKGVYAVILEWSTTATGPWSVNTPIPGTAVGTYHYYVRQTNVYATCPGDTLECTGPAAPITLTITEIPAPQIVGGPYHFCNEGDELTQTLTANRGDDECSTTSVWFLNGDSVAVGDTYTVTLADIRPATNTNVDKTVTFVVKAYNANTGCYSVASSSVTITFHQTPQIHLSYLDTICPRPEGVDFTMQVTSTQTEAPYTVLQSSDFTANRNNVLNTAPYQLVSSYSKPYTKITDFECGHTYHLYYEVTDANNCVVKDTATFTADDRENPVVNPATWTKTLNQCNLEGTNVPEAITTMAGFTGMTLVTDNCGIDHFTHKDTIYVSETDTCETVLVRTYTFYDYCNNTATFTQTFIAHDSVAPYFAGLPGRPLYQRLEPKRGENCTFNSLSKAEFVMAFLGKVNDNCVTYDSAYLYDHADFYWENSTRFGHVVAYDSLDIFREFNETVWVDGNKQLTIEVVVWDDCGNTADTLAFWFEPDSLVLEPAITIDPDRICLGDTSYLYFDSSKVSYTHYELAHPLSFAWGSADADINFDDPTNVNTFVVPGTGDKTYHVNMTVSDAYGCEVSSDSVELYVKSAPVMKIIPVTEFGLQPPYCPTIGTVHLVAVSAVDSTFVPNLTYTWTSSQSLDVSARGDTTRLYVIPDSCSYIYDAQVFVTDTIYGCTAEASILVPVEDQAPQYIGDPHADTAYVGPGCEMKVTDFTHYVTPATIDNICGWGFSRYTIWQVPAVGTVITEETPVYVYILTPCSEDTVKILDKFVNIPDSSRISVMASVQPSEGCAPVTFNFTATTENAVGVPTYMWTKGTSTATISTEQSFSRTEMTEAGQMESHYTFKVKVTDPVTNCTATSSVQVAVYDSLPVPNYEVYPNDRCLPVYNGLIRLIEVPRGYTYELFSDENLVDAIRTQIPALDANVDTTSIIFDELEGNLEYMVKITTIHGCVTRFNVFVPDSAKNPVFNDEVTTILPTHCDNSNGQIVIVPEAGYEYHVFSVLDPDNEIPASSYNNLPSGDYIVYKYNIATACDTNMLFTIPESDTALTFPVMITPNTLCSTESGNGKITLTQTGVDYVITNFAGDTLYNNVNGELGGLKMGDYIVYGEDQVTHCLHHEQVHVYDSTNNPVFTITTHDNQFCENANNTVNGSVTVTPATAYTYQYFVGTGAEDAWVVISDPSQLAAGHYKVVATDENGCKADTVFDINNNQVEPTVEAESEENASCDSTIMAFNGKVNIRITNYDNTFKPYIVTLDTVDSEGNTHVIATNNNANALTTFNGLGTGIYNYKVIDKYLCEFTGEVEVEQAELDSLKLVQTPNTMCEPGYDHPGNGTITVLPPYDDAASNNFAYAYFYAPVGLKEQGDSLHVDYSNLSKTMYHLEDTCYYVTVLDHRTGCMVYDTITVELGRDTLTITGDPTPNKNCIAPFTGSIQWHVTYKRFAFDYELYPYLAIPDPGYLFSIDGGLTYQTDSLFTGLQDGDYYVTVIDTTTHCVTSTSEPVRVEKTPSDIVIVPTVNNNHACEPTLYDGSISVHATSVLFNPAVYEFSFNGGAFGFDTMWTGLGAGSYHIVARDTISGCEGFIDVIIETINECVPIPHIDSRDFCLNEVGATLTATATLPDGCENRGFNYVWFKECHADTLYGSTIPVATDEDGCCLYFVTVTSIATGCTAVDTVNVCVYAPGTITFTVDGTPITGNRYDNCENMSRTIGVVQNGWVNAFWTMNHNTIRPDDEPEFEFFVNVPDSIAKYADNLNRWAVTYNPADPKFVTFCLDVFDIHGCHAQRRFNLVNYPLVYDTIRDTLCEVVITEDMAANLEAEQLAALEAALTAGTITYPYTITYSMTFPRTLEEGCDSIVTFEYVYLGIPEYEDDVDDSYCYGVTFDEIKSLVTITGAVEESIKYYLNDVEITDPSYVFAHAAEQINLRVDFNAGKEECGESRQISFYVDSVPEFTAALTIDSLCADAEYEVTVPTYECHHHIADSCHVSAIMVDSTDAANIVVETFAEDITGSYIISPVLLSYNGKYFGFIVRNECGADTILAKLIVDTLPTGKVTVNAICDGDDLNASWSLTNSTDVLSPVTAVPYVKMPTSTNFVELASTTVIDYSFNDAQLYYMLTNKCGSSTTDTVVMVVNHKPEIFLAADPLNTCAATFEDDFSATFGYSITNADGSVVKFYEPNILTPGSPEPTGTVSYPYVLPHGTAITAHGWLLAEMNASGDYTYTPVTVAEIKAQALATTEMITIKYYATNACGSDTVGPFDLLVDDVPVLTVTSTSICPDDQISDVVTYSVDWNSAPGSVSYVAVKADGSAETTVDATTTFSSLYTNGYLDGELLVIAQNDCGSDTEHVALAIPTYQLTPGAVVPACSGSECSAFIQTTPTLTVTNMTDTDMGWFSTTTGTVSNTDPSIALTDPVTTPIWIYKKWVTSCDETITSDPMLLTLLTAPTISIDDTAICEGSTLDLAGVHYTVSGLVTGVTIDEPTWTINGNAIVAGIEYGMEYNNAEIVATAQTTCGPVTATSHLTINPAPEVSVIGNDTCEGKPVDFVATPDTYVSYTFQLDEETPVTQSSNVYSISSGLGEGMHTITVTAVDANNCTSAIAGTATVKVTDAPEFIFMTMDGEETHNFSSTAGQGLSYIWMVDTTCNDEDKLVYVEYFIYHDGVLLDDDATINDHICVFHTAPGTSNDYMWTTRNTFYWEALDGSPRDFTNYYQSGAPKQFVNAPTSASYNQYGTHFPYGNLKYTTATNYFDDFWMHYLAKRPVTQDISTFAQPGNYKIVFKLYSTTSEVLYKIYYRRYTNSDSTAWYPFSTVPGADNSSVQIGGHASLVGDPDLTLLAIDSISINVGGTPVECSPVTAAPSLAPELTVDESKVSPDMEVWPNPAPAATTTLKARVHNMNGNATVTLTTLGGKQVYEGNVYIDNDNYYFECNVNSLSVGSYIMTVRTADAIVTKKVIVTVLAH